jgi:bacterioferritin-associated ferredoxin
MWKSGKGEAYKQIQVGTECGKGEANKQIPVGTECGKVERGGL